MITSILNIFMFYFLLSISAIHTPYIPRLKGTPYAKSGIQMKGTPYAKSGIQMKGPVGTTNSGKLKERLDKMKRVRGVKPPMNKEDIMGMMDNPAVTEIMKNPDMMMNMMPEGQEKEEFRKMMDNPIMKSMMSNPELMKGMMSMTGF